MTLDKFKEIIKSIGFVESNPKFEQGGRNKRILYEYKEFEIYMYYTDYNFFDGYIWQNYKLDDLNHLKNTFKKELRAIKLKELLK